MERSCSCRSSLFGRLQIVCADINKAKERCARHHIQHVLFAHSRNGVCPVAGKEIVGKGGGKAGEDRAGSIGESQRHNGKDLGRHHQGALRIQADHGGAALYKVQVKTGADNTSDFLPRCMYLSSEYNFNKWISDEF